MEEYVIFTVIDKDGNEVEMAVIDEFEVAHKTYLSAARVEGDAVSEEGLYIYKVKYQENDFAVEKITDAEEYKAVAKAYEELLDKE